MLIEICEQLYGEICRIYVYLLFKQFKTPFLLVSKNQKNIFEICEEKTQTLRFETLYSELGIISFEQDAHIQTFQRSWNQDMFEVIQVCFPAALTSNQKPHYLMSLFYDFYNCILHI